MTAEIKRTPLYALHVSAGAKMVEFAGYEMPIMYQRGIKQEHLHCRAKAGLFDVSHMGQLLISGRNAQAELEKVLPIDLEDLPIDKQRYSLLTSEDGGIIDDLMISNTGEGFYVVVNAARKQADMAHLVDSLSDNIDISVLDNHALLALQGPWAVDALVALNPAVKELVFMDSVLLALCGVVCRVSRSGYTGEDGFEISVPKEHACKLAESLLNSEGVEWIGLGARDSLRLEAGLCLYGSDIDLATTPVEASLTWAIARSRRAGGEKTGGFKGELKILPQISGPRSELNKLRVGLIGQTKAPVRAGSQLYNSEGKHIGLVTSGTYAPSVEHPVAMGYVQPKYSQIGDTVFAEVRGKRLPMTITKMPFLPPSYVRGG